MRLALVYDRVNKFGGAERVLLTLHQIFPDAPLFTLVHDPQKSPWANVFKVISTFLNSIPFLRSKHEILAPIAPLAFETLNFDQFDVVISVTSSDAKSIITKPKTLHICYCLTPTRYYWSGEKQYGKDPKMKLLPQVIKKYLRTVDLLTSTRPDEYIAISNEVKTRIKNFYNRDSSVIHPPLDDKFFVSKPTSKEDREYYLVVSRLVPYKKVDLVVKAFNKLQKPLLVIGTGSEMQSLKEISKPCIKFLGQVSDEDLSGYYKNAKAVIFPQEEDYGLVPLESQASGTPVIAYGKGGALETVIDKKTGVFFKKQTTKSLINSINRFESMDIEYKACIDQAKKFTSTEFKSIFSAKVKTLLKDYQSKYTL